MKANKYLHKKYETFLTHIVNRKDNKNKIIQKVPQVCDYPNISTEDLPGIFVVVDTIDFIGIDVGIFMDKTLPKTTPLSSPGPLDEPTPLYPTFETCVGRGTLVGRQRTKSSTGVKSILKLESTY